MDIFNVVDNISPALRWTAITTIILTMAAMGISLWLVNNFIHGTISKYIYWEIGLIIDVICIALWVVLLIWTSIGE